MSWIKTQKSMQMIYSMQCTQNAQKYEIAHTKPKMPKKS